MANLKELDWYEVIDRMSRCSTSAVAQEDLKAIQPFESPDLALSHTGKVESARKILLDMDQPYLESIDLFHVWFDRIKKGAVLNTLELKDIRLFCQETVGLKNSLEDIDNPWGQSLYDRLMDGEIPLSAIDQILTEEGGIRTDASEILYNLFQERQHLELTIRKTLDRLVKDHSMENILQDKYVTTREGRWVLPVISGMRSGLKGIIHDISHSKRTVFMEPQEVVEANNRLRHVASSIDEEVKRLLTQLAQFLNGLCKEFTQTRETLLEADTLFGIANFSNQIDSQPIRFAQEIDVKDLRHPTLSLTLEGDVIPNSVQLPKDRKILILSGPNAGGKTVLLKSLGLAAQMSRCGLPVCCAPESTIPFFNDVFVTIGDAQSVDEHLSTFAAHLKALTEAENAKGVENLILIDEICGSTDPEEGAALARSFVEQYSKNNVYGVITSHLGPLKQGWPDESGVISGSMEYNEESHKPTYHLIMGIHGQSLALKTAKMAGVPPNILDRAYDFLSPESRAREKGLDEIESLRTQVTKLQKDLKQELHLAREEKRKHTTLVDKFRREKDKWMEKALASAQKKIDEAVQQTIRDPKNIDFRRFKANMPQVVKAQSAPLTPTNPKEFEERFPPGAKVFVPELKQQAIVQGFPNAKGELPILSNSMRLTVHWEKLVPPSQGPGGKPTQPKKSKFITSHLSTGGTREIDLRGETVEDALEKLEIALDKAALAQEDRVKIIHGHGTEALKKAVRAYLSRSVYIRKWSAGDPDNESDGLTWAELAD